MRKLVMAKRILGILCFSILFALLFQAASHLLMHKQVEGRWDMTSKVVGFFNEEPNSFDVLFFGSSHMYCSVNPAVLKQESGLSSYVFATQKQPLWITYYYIIEALKTQSPKVIFVEAHMASMPGRYLDEGTNHTAIDPLPLSRNKVDMIYAAVPKGQRRFYIFDIMKYHERWKELEKFDYTRKYEGKTDIYKGYVCLTEAPEGIEPGDYGQVGDTARITDKNALYINKIINLAQEKGIRLVFIKAPSNAKARQMMAYNAVGKIAAERGVEYFNYNDPAIYEELGLELSGDFYDVHHLNESGMKKFVPDLNRRFLSGEQGKSSTQNE